MKILLILIIACCQLGGVFSQVQVDCDTRRSDYLDLNNNLPILDCKHLEKKKPSNEDIVTCARGKDDCIDGMGYCWHEGKCYVTTELLKQVKIDFTADLKVLINDNVPVKDDTGTTQANAGTNDASARTFGIGGPPPSTSFNPMCAPPSFPFTCGIGPFSNMNDLLQPPINVPFCRRIPCTNKNDNLEMNPAKCMANPGCYFDISLARLRQIYGPRAYPGVPACHKVINNNIFHKYALDFMRKYGSWRPAYTLCLIRTYVKEMELEQERQPGCSMINSLTYLNYQPKLAGWTNITPRECLLFVPGSCWHVHFGCVYGCRGTDDIKVPRGAYEQQGRSFLPPTQMYGRTRCQIFPDATGPYGYYNTPSHTFLKAYHQCLAAGCSLHQSAAYTYYYHLNNISRSVPGPYRRHFWQQVYNGNCNGNNFQKYLELYTSLPPFPQMPSTFGILPNNMFSTNIGNNVLPFSLETGDNLGRNFNTDDSNSPQSDNPESRTFGIIPPPPQYRQPQCPYQVPRFNIPNINIEPISMRTCCERPICYHTPRSQRVYTGVSSYYGQPRWGPCSKTCGGGTRTLDRPCIKINGQPCENDGNTKEKCNTFPCPKYSDWGKYSECSKSCGGGTQYRTRTCISYRGEQCRSEDGHGSSMSRNCKEGACPKFEKQGDFGSCISSGSNPNCGKGSRRRSLVCIDGGEYGCPSENRYEEKPCELYCGEWRVAGYTQCISCLRTPIYQCVTNDGSQGNCNPDDRPNSSPQLCCFNNNNAPWWLPG